MTLPLDVVTNIRRLHYAEHWKVGTIATEPRVHHEAVKRALGPDGEAGASDAAGRVQALHPRRAGEAPAAEGSPTASSVCS
jgi:hypothetical protein